MRLKGHGVLLWADFYASLLRKTREKITSKKYTAERIRKAGCFSLTN